MDDSLRRGQPQAARRGGLDRIGRACGKVFCKGAETYFATGSTASPLAKRDKYAYILNQILEKRRKVDNGKGSRH